MRAPRNLYGLPMIPQFGTPEHIHPKMMSDSDTSGQGGPTWRFGALVVYKKPITEFWGDIQIPVNAAGSLTTLRSGAELPETCTGVRFINVVPGVTVSINGNGSRQVLNGDKYDDSEIKSIMIVTDATGTCAVQPEGLGE